MTRSAAADASTRPLSEVARHLVIPSGIVDSLWFDVEERCREFGDEFDAWQDGLGQVVLGVREDGMFAATVGGVTLSIPRQVAKTFLVMRIVVALCTLFPNLTVLWTAHRTRTATMTFTKMKGFVMRPAARRYLMPGSNQGTAIRDANGEQQIPFTNGSVIMFGAREQGFGRGFDEVDIEVFDEAQILTEKSLEDMVAATNQSRFEHGALLFYMGTPPRPNDPGEVFTNRRNEALQFKGGDAADFGSPTIGEDSVYVECSADKDGDPEDRAQWAKANPSFPHRTPLVSLRRLRKNLPAVDSWVREGLGVWDTHSVGKPVISPDLWKDLETEDPPLTGDLAYGVKFSADGLTAALSVALRPDEGPTHLEAVAHIKTDDGMKWLEDWLVKRWRKSVTVVVDGKSHAGAFVLALRQRGVPPHRVQRPTVDEVITAHSMIVDAVASGSVSHIDDGAVQAAVASAGRRAIGKSGGWGFESVDGGDVTVLESITFAHYGVMSAKRSTGTDRSQGRTAVVM